MQPAASWLLVADRTDRGMATSSHLRSRAATAFRWPGKIAPAVSNEMLAAEDWMPTLAGLAGEHQRIPTDRPIDGIDASAYMLGKSPKSGRDTYLFFSSDGELMSVK